MTFTTPWALLLLLAIPALWWIAWPRRNRKRWLRENISLALRSIIIFGVVLALGGAQQVQSSDSLATVFLLDVSDSVTRIEQEAGVAYIQQALAAMPDSDKAGVVVFGADALVERPAINSTIFGFPASVPVTQYTDIAGAIRLGLTLFPDDAARRMIILSDGQANIGDARQAAQLAAASGVEVSVLPLPQQSGPEVRLDSLSAPAVLHESEQFDLSLTVNSNIAMDVPLQIFSQGQLVAQQNLSLQTGDNSFVLPLAAGQTGFTTYQARLAPPADTFTQNNSLDTFSEVKGPLSVLVVAPQADEAQPLNEALQGTGMTVAMINPAELPSDLGRLSEYAAVILVNTPSFSLAPRQLELLQSYVRDLGHGLVVIGGEESYGPGGYFQTALEETLPVEMTISDKQRLPGMTLLTVIDKSGSMSSGGTQQGSGPRKVELAKEAIYRSVDLLVPWDRIGVIAFDSAARWVQEPVPATGTQRIKDAVGTIRAGGGTDIFAGLKLAAEAIVKEASVVRHIVLLTDGGANPTGILELTKELADQEITISVVAIGEGYAPFLEEVAQLGGGRFHFAHDASVIPQIFAQETSLASRSYLVEETFTPQVSSPSPILQGFRQLPPLHGYVATSPKLTAQTVLRGGSEQDPILAQWQYGLGRAVAWTSDAKGQWAVEWLGWDQFPRFWSQLVRWTIVEGSGGGLESQIRLEGDRAIVSAEVLNADGSYRNDLAVQLSLIDPNLAQRTITLPQTAPGLYEGNFRPDETGIYLLRVVGREAGPEAGQEGDELVAAQTRGFVIGYSPEYRTTEPDTTLLPDIASLGHGQILSPTAPEAAFAHTLPPAQGSTDLWPWFLLVAILLLPLDVAIRRVIVGREDIRHLWLKLHARLPQRSPTPQPSVSSAGRLLKVKQKEPPDGPSPDGPPPDPVVSATPSKIEVSPSPVAKPTPAPSTPSPKSDEVEAETTVRRLMRAKQRRQKRQD